MTWPTTPIYLPRGKGLVRTIGGAKKFITNARECCCDAIYVTRYASTNGLWKVSSSGSGMIWEADIPYGTGLVRDAAGNIYAASYSTGDYNLRKFYTTGEEVWAIQVDTAATIHPQLRACMINSAGDIVVTGQPDPSEVNNLWKISATGSILTALPRPADGLSTVRMAQDADDNYYMAHNPFIGGIVTKMDASFGVTWSIADGSAAYDVAVGDAGYIYTASIRTAVNHAIQKRARADGALAWSYDTGSTYALRVLYHTDGYIYAAGNTGGTYTLWKLDTAGNLVAGYDTGVLMRDIAVAASGAVYASGSSSSGKGLWCFNNDLELQWEMSLGADGMSVCLDE